MSDEKTVSETVVPIGQTVPAPAAPKEDAQPKGGAKTPPANIKFIGKPHEINGKKIEAEPYTTINSGMDTYELPAAELQREGFYHPHARKISRIYPFRYKLIKAKGGK